MVNKKIVKIIFTTILLVACLFIFHTISQAASFSASISKTTVTVGDTFTVTVKASNAAGMYTVTNSNSNVSLSSGSKSEFLEDESTTLTFKAVSAGTVTITAKATDMTDLDDDTKKVTGSKSFTVTVKAKSTSTSNGESNNGSTTNTTTTKPTFSSRNEKVYATSQVNVRSSYSTSSSVLGTLSAGDSVTRIGIATKSVNGILWSKVTYNGKTAYISSSFLTTTKPDTKENNDNKDDKKDEEKSDNANLKTLEVTPTGLSPAFSNLTTEYTMTVGSDIDKLDINAVAEDEKAKVSISGNEDLELGTNTIKIKVTAEDGTVKTYVIAVTKEDKEQLKLSELLVEGLPLEPEFDSNVYEYTLTLDRSDVSELNITATPNEESAEVEIVGNTELKAGANVVTILVKSSDGEEITTYQITVNVPETVVPQAFENEDLYKYIGIGIAVIALIIIIVVIIRKSRKNKEEDYTTYYGAYETKDNKNSNDTNLVDNQEEVKLDELPKLANEDLPKSLRKDKAEVKEDSEIIKEEKSDRNKKIDELYSMSGDVDSKRKRGKHF